MFDRLTDGQYTESGNPLLISVFRMTINTTVNELSLWGRVEVGVDADVEGADVVAVGVDGAFAAGDVTVLSLIHCNTSLR